ncbi:DUF1178 family protein [Hoeflea sp. G2-23]|uniref:DUF1178 family protein n=1 Tax=Hoeflea algicola TaxID=2983763 RepID=A0ABT3ZA54_9HYPH|nr:DUF1178 family protein [Hoeflea algicola]MCY0148655.1 DUF1178 family protein [Hoeflea algicola]
MIKFNLQCDNDHEFEGWFSSSTDFDAQIERELVECPSCGSRAIGKALMTPSVSVSRGQDKRPLALAPEKHEMMRKLREMVKAVRDNSEDVGDRFPDEARKIHHGETEARGIIGKASQEDARALVEEGIGIAPLPDLPEDLS